MKFKARVMEGSQLERSLARIAHEIIEKNNGAEGICLLGIKRRGIPMARILHDHHIPDQLLRVRSPAFDPDSCDLCGMPGDLLHPQDHLVQCAVPDPRQRIQLFYGHFRKLPHIFVSGLSKGSHRDPLSAPVQFLKGGSLQDTQHCLLLQLPVAGPDPGEQYLFRTKNSRQFLSGILYIPIQFRSFDR